MNRVPAFGCLLSLVLLSGPVSPVQAQNLVPLRTPENLQGEVVAQCEKGKGCSCSTHNTAENLLVVHGFDTRVPDGFAGDQRAQTIVIDVTSGQVYRTKEPRGRINAAYDGNGPCEPEDLPELVPLDGLWQWRTLNETTEGCPPMLAGLLAKNRTDTMRHRVIWDGTFHPDRLAASLPAPEMGSMSPYEWRKLAPGRWMSDNIDSRECSDGTCVQVAVALTMNLTAPDRITGLLTLRSRVEGAHAASIAGFGVADCKVRVRYQIDRVAP